MKSILHISVPASLRLATAALVAVGTTAHGEILVSESFSGYNAGTLNGQAARGLGLTGNWAGTTFQNFQETGLSMNGVHSSGGSVNQSTGGNFARRVSAAFTSPLPTGQLYGSYLFSSSIGVGRTVGSIGVGSSGTDTDATSAFVWAGNGYNAATNSWESPGVRALGTNVWSPAAAQLTGNETYLMLFEFDAATGITTSWVLNQAQVSHYLSTNTLNSTTLNAALDGPNEDQIVWYGYAAASTAIGPMAHLHLFGLQSTTAAFSFTWDEFRVSSSSLVQAVTEPGVAPVGSYQAWRNSYPALAAATGSPAQDHDGDGVANVLEFVLGGDPTVPATGILPQGAIDGDNFLFTFKRTTASQSGTLLNFQWGTNLTSWTNVLIGLTSSGPHDGGVAVTVSGENVEVRVPRSNAPGGELHGRLNATQP